MWTTRSPFASFRGWEHLKKDSVSEKNRLACVFPNTDSYEEGLDQPVIYFAVVIRDLFGEVDKNPAFVLK